LAHCPVELNLMPDSTLKLQRFNQKKPYLLATVYSMAAVVWALGFFYNQLAQFKDANYQKVHGKVEPEQLKQQKFNQAYNTELKGTMAKVEKVVGWVGDRYYWVDVIQELRDVLLRVEGATRETVKADAGIWIETFTTAAPAGDQLNNAPTAGAPPPTSAASDAGRAAFAKRYGLRDMGPTPARAAPVAAADTSAGPKKPTDPNEVASIDITFRAVSLAYAEASANKEVAFKVLDALKSSPMFDSTNTVFSSIISPEEAPGTFTFKITAQLKRPLKL